MDNGDWPEPCPGYNQYWGMARERDQARGGIALVMPSGKYIYVAFEITPAVVNHEARRWAIEPMLMSAAKEMAKHLDKLISNESRHDTEGK